MANNQNLAPFPWRPVAAITPMRGSGQVSAGDWITVFVNYLATNAARVGAKVVYTPGLFLIHVIYTPNSDDATQHNEYSVTYGGSATNRRREYRINPGWCFQVPFDGQLSIVAGGDATENTETAIGVVKGFSPRLWAQQQALIDQVRARADAGDPEALMMLEGFGPVGIPRAERAWPPPVVGVPQLVPATWIDIPAGGPAIPFPDGAVSISTVAAAIPRLTIHTLGQNVPLDLPISGVARQLGALAQGGFGTDGTPATWESNAALTAVDIWSSLGG